MEENVRLPDQSLIFPTVSARIDEIKAIDELLNECEHGARAYQKLPRHMQRRAMSSNPKRLPRSIREKNKREMGNNKIKLSKRPSRKFRRRPSHLLSEYNRRQKAHKWLETHIWHAKRFHMTKQWSFVIPDRPTNKGYRSCLRAIKESCLIQDVSFESCIEIDSPFKKIVSAFKDFLSFDDHERLFSKKESEWNCCTLFKKGRCPYGAVGDIQILFDSVCGDDTSINCKAWIWCHPSMDCDLKEVIIEAFKLITIENQSTLNGLKDENMESSVEMSDVIKSESKEISDSKETSKKINTALEKISSKHVPFSRTTKYFSQLDKSIKITILTGTLNKFRLFGPRAYSILKNVFQSSTISSNVSEDPAMKLLIKKTLEIESCEYWWEKYFIKEDCKSCMDTSHKAWLELEKYSPFERRVYSLVVRDPRFFLPMKKVAAMEIEAPTMQPKSNVSFPKICLPLLNSEIRDEVTLTMKSTHLVNKLRSQTLLPGTQFPIVKEESRIPVLILYNPNNDIVDLGPSFEVVFPSGWGSVSWISLIMNGAIAGGLSQQATLMTEYCLQPQTHLFPDTSASERYNSELYQRRKEDYFKRPPICRENYLRNGIQYPFCTDWSKLITSIDPNFEKFFVLRDRRALKSLSTISSKRYHRIILKDTKIISNNGKIICNNTEIISKDIEMVSKDTKIISKDSEITKSPRKRKLEDITNVELCTTSPNKKISTHPIELSSPNIDISFLKSFPCNALVGVRVILLGKGSLEASSMICLPVNEDFESKEFVNGSSFNMDCTLVEEPHIDEHVSFRKDLKKLHNKNTKQIQRLRNRAKRKVRDKLDFQPEYKKKVDLALEEIDRNHQEIIKERSLYKEKMDESWLYPENLPFQQDCLRKIFGYTHYGGFCMKLGRSAGLGWVVYGLLLEHLQSQLLDRKLDFSSKRDLHIFVLVRNPSSFQYRWARLIILNKD